MPPQGVMGLNMNIKRIFGAILTMLGTGSIIYAALLFINNQGGNKNMRSLIIYSIIGLLFFLAGLSLIRTTKDEA
jgi:heme O synthase-like polyprenyltransferase